MMVPLKKFQQMLKWVCVYRSDDSMSNKKKMFFSFFLVASVIINTVSAFASTKYFITFFSYDLESCLNCPYQLAAALSLAYSLLSMYFLRHKVIDVFDKLSVLFTKCTKRYD